MVDVAGRFILTCKCIVDVFQYSMWPKKCLIADIFSWHHLGIHEEKSASVLTDKWE